MPWTVEQESLSPAWQTTLVTEDSIPIDLTGATVTLSIDGGPDLPVDISPEFPGRITHEWAPGETDLAPGEYPAVWHIEYADTTTDDIDDTLIIESIQESGGYEVDPDTHLKPPAPVLPQQDHTLITAFQTGHGYTVNPSGGGSNANDTTDFVLGTQAVKLVTDGAGGNNYVRKTGLSLDFTGKYVKVWVKVDAWTHLDVLKLILATDSGFADEYGFVLNTAYPQDDERYLRPGKWVEMIVPWSHGTQDAGTTDRSNITAVNLQVFDDNTGNPRTVHWNGLATVDEPAAFPNGVVSLTFDDGYDTQYTEGKAYLDRYGYRGTAYLIVQRIGTAGRLDEDQLHAMQDSSGWEIGAHAFFTENHDSANAYLDISGDEMDVDMRLTKQFLQERGFRGADQFAYPQGRYNDEVLEHASSHFASARTVEGSIAETVQPADPNRLRSLGVQFTDTVGAITALIDKAVAGKAWLILTFHQIDASAAATSVTVANFQDIIDYIAASGIAVKTVGEVLRNTASSTGTAGVTDHGALSGLADDDHPQYALDSDLTTHAAAGDPHPGYATDSDLSGHASDTTAIHGIPDTSVLATATDVSSAISTHAGAGNPHPGYATDGDLAAHEADTTNIHGISNTANLLDTSSAAGGDLTGTLGNLQYAAGSIVNADISASAAIARSKLDFGSGLVNADIASGAAVAYSKLALTGAILNADLAGSIAYSKLALTGAILNADLAGSIAYSKLSLTGAIVNADLASGIDASKLTTGTLPNARIAAGSITNAQLAGSITTANLADGADFARKASTNTFAARQVIQRSESSTALTAATPALEVQATDTTLDALGASIGFVNQGGFLMAGIYALPKTDATLNKGADLVFATKDAAGSAYLERMRITEAGSVSIGGALSVGGVFSSTYHVTPGNAGPYSIYSGTTVEVLNRSDATYTPFLVSGMAAQSGDLTRWRDSSGGVLASVAADGTIKQGGVAVSLTGHVHSYQPLDSDLTTISGLTATTDNVIQSVGSAWASRTPAQLKATLALAKGDVGLGNVDNTSDATLLASSATLTNKTIALGSNTVSGTVSEFNAALTSADFYTSGGTDVALADGGTGASLTDPNADRVLFWDDSAGAVTWLTIGSNLSITGTQLDASPGATTIADGDYGDIVVSGTGTVFSIDSGVIVNADVNASAAIARSKLDFGSGLVNADIAAAAAIAYSKLALTGAILNADLAGSIAYSKLSLTGAILNADLAGSIATSKLTDGADFARLASANIYTGGYGSTSATASHYVTGGGGGSPNAGSHSFGDNSGWKITWGTRVAGVYALRASLTDTGVFDAIGGVQINGTSVLARSGHTGTQLASTISDFDTQVRTSTLAQMAAPGANVSMNTKKLTNLAVPTAGTSEAATAAYADYLRAGPICIVQRTTTLSIADGTITEVPFNSEVEDSSSMYTTVNTSSAYNDRRIRIQHDGVWHLNAVVALQRATNTPNRRIFDILINKPTARANSTALTTGDRVISSGNVYVCTNAGTTSGSLPGGYATATTPLTDGTCTMTFLGTSTLLTGGYFARITPLQPASSDDVHSVFGFDKRLTIGDYVELSVYHSNTAAQARNLMGDGNSRGLDTTLSASFVRS